MNPFDAKYKLIFQILQVTTSKAQIIAELKDVLYKKTTKNIVVCFVIPDQSDYIRQLFFPYTDDQTEKYFSDYFTNNLLNSTVPPNNKNPFEKWNKSFPTHNRTLSNNICVAAEVLARSSPKNLRYFLLPSVDVVMSIVNADKDSPLYFIKKQMKRVKQFARNIADHN